MNEDNSSQQKSNLPDLETLKGRLEQQQAAKLKAEQIVSTLSRIKAREKASRKRITSRDESAINTSVERKHTASNSAVKEKSNLLKRKLEEDRARLESCKGSDNLNKVSEVVETIRAQLEDRDKVMQQLFLSAQQQHEYGSSADDASFTTVNENVLEPDLPDDIKQKIADLEAKVIDLQENLKEKDNVISARTQAITLLSEDLSRKSKTTLDTLEETQHQMRQMQNNFISIEEKMKQENKRLKDEAEERKQKCLLAEKNLRIVEAARFELSTRVAELQEKVVALQTKNIDLEKNVGESGTKQSELTDALETAKQATVKMKAKFKIKLKALEEERDNLKKMSEDGNLVVSLQEKIAELEEEKEQYSLVKERITDLEQKLSQQGDDLHSHVKAITKLESEKLDLIQVLQEHNMLLANKDSLISRLQQQLTEVEQLKVSAELRTIELEEKLDAAIKDRVNFDNETQIDVDKIKEKLLKQEETIKELQMKLSLKQSELSQGAGDNIDTTSEIEEWKRKYFDMEAKCLEVNDLYKKLELRLDNAEKQNRVVAIDCECLRNTVSQLHDVVNQQSSSQVQEEIPIHNKMLVESKSQYSLDSERDAEIDRLREELAATTEELHRLAMSFDSMNSTSHQIDELSKQILEKDKVLSEVNSELEQRTRKLSEYKKFHKLKSEDVLRVSHELENITATSQDKIAELEQQLRASNEKEAVLMKEITELKENRSVIPSEHTQKLKKLAANLKLKAKACKEFEERVAQLENTLEEKNKLIDELKTDENKHLPAAEIGFSDQLSVAPAVITAQNVVQSYPLHNVDDLLAERAGLNSKLTEQQELISHLQNELLSVQEEKSSIFSQMEKLHETEFSRNDEIFRNLETQIAGSKNEVISLEAQLADVMSKYEQAWAKLQEKEAYIESIESDLVKAQEKMRLIESNTNEMQQTLKEKTDRLNLRIQQAESINSQFEKYKLEVEQRLTYSVENEAALRADLSDRINENTGLQQRVNQLEMEIVRFQQDANDMRDYVSKIQNELANGNNLQLLYNQSIDEIDKLKSEIIEIKLMNEKTINSLQESERFTVQSLELELENFNEKCNIIEKDRNSLSKEFEVVQGQNQSLVEQLEKQRLDFEMRYSVLIGERNHFEEAYLKLKQEVTSNEEVLTSISKDKSKEIQGIMLEQNQLLEKLHTEFKQKEQSYFERIRELEDYNLQLQESLRTIESNAESLRTELNKVGTELTSCKEELSALKLDQERCIYLKNELEVVKEDLSKLLEEKQHSIETLEIELLREKAKKEIDSVVMEAADKIETISHVQETSESEHQRYPSKNDENPPLFKFADNQENDVFNAFSATAPIQQECQNIDEINSINTELNQKLNAVLLENERLLSLVEKYESSGQLQFKEKPSPFNETTPYCSGRVENKDEEDGWGWGSEEPLIEQHATTIAMSANICNVPQNTSIEVSNLEEKLRELENVNCRLSDELKQSQIRCSKLVKKAKELKTKSENLERGSRERSLGFEDLDFAMQEELRGQIEVLEKNLQEALNENRNWKTEKEHLSRKVDTLISGNERLVDMKERQDIELAMYQKQNSDLKQQILAFEWKIEELMEDHEKLTNNCTEMEMKINSLANENEHLIKVVGDMKDTQKSSEQQETTVGSNNPTFTMFRDNSSGNSGEIKMLYDSLIMDYENLSSEKNKIIAVNSSLNDSIGLLNGKINELELENRDLKVKVQECNFGSGNINSENTARLLEENESLHDICKLNEESLNNYKIKLEKIEHDYKALEDSLNNSRKSEESLKTIVQDLESKNGLIKNELEKKYNDLLNEFNIVNKKSIESDEVFNDKTENKDDVVEKEEATVDETPSSAVLFRGFASDTPETDPFKLVEDDITPEDDEWNANGDASKRDSNVCELTEQVTTLTSLLEEKETELEMSKQLVDNIKLQGENLQDCWSEKFEHLKSEKTDDGSSLEVYEGFINTAEKKFKDNLILKDEEIAHLTCELSSKKQQLVNLQKEIAQFVTCETDLKNVAEKFKLENEMEQKEIDLLCNECLELRNRIAVLNESEQDLRIKLSETDSQLSKMKLLYSECLGSIETESKNKIRIEEDYNKCCRYLEERDQIILMKDNELEVAKLKISELDEVVNSYKIKDMKNVNVTSTTPKIESQLSDIALTATMTSDSGSNLINEDIINRYKDLIQQRDIEIERLMQVVGEAEERLIRAEERRIGDEEANGLQLRLDEALYTLHLRDVRCEELTLELMRLLEERDTLQLRLSTAIRMNEDLRCKLTPTNIGDEQALSLNESNPVTPPRTISDFETAQQTLDSDMVRSDSESRVKLNEKLGELHSVGYQRDLSVHQDRVKRHNEQMHLYSKSSSPQPSSLLSTGSEEQNTSGGFFSWIFGSAGSGSNSQMDV